MFSSFVLDKYREVALLEELTFVIPRYLKTIRLGYVINEYTFNFEVTDFQVTLVKVSLYVYLYV